MLSFFFLDSLGVVQHKREYLFVYFRKITILSLIDRSISASACNAVETFVTTLKAGTYVILAGVICIIFRWSWCFDLVDLPVLGYRELRGFMFAIFRTLCV
jgi:hypothetical protein